MELTDIKKHQKLLHAGLEYFTKLTIHYDNKSPYVKTTIKPLLYGDTYSNFDLWNSQVCFLFHTSDDSWCSDFQITLTYRDVINDANYLSWVLQHIDSKLWTTYDEFFQYNDKCGNIGKSISRECGPAIFNELARDFKEAVN